MRLFNTRTLGGLFRQARISGFASSASHLASGATILKMTVLPFGNSCTSFEEVGMSNRRGAGRRKVGRKKRRMRAKIRHRK